MRGVRRSIVPTVLMVGVLLGCGGTTARAPSDRKAPDFALPDLDGKVVHLSDSAGKVRLVNFWATWCAPCREEIPTFKEFYGKYEGRGFTILAISDEGADVIAPFVKENGILYPNLVGNDEIGEKFGGLVGYPTTFLVDGEGKILDSFIGPVPRNVLEPKIQAALGGA
jgi:thiol-disulfide isomerase/thioredoxin